MSRSACFVSHHTVSWRCIASAFRFHFRKLRNARFGLHFSNCKVSSASFDLQDFQLAFASFAMQVSNCKVRLARFPIDNRKLRAQDSSCKLRVARFPTRASICKNRGVVVWTPSQSIGNVRVARPGAPALPSRH